MIKKIAVAKAEPIGPDQKVDSVLIEIGGEPMTHEDHSMSTSAWMVERAEYYNNQAARIEDALHQSLPGGTYDRLLNQMLQRKAGLLKVSLFDVDTVNRLFDGKPEVKNA